MTFRYAVIGRACLSISVFGLVGGCGGSSSHSPEPSPGGAPGKQGNKAEPNPSAKGGSASSTPPPSIPASIPSINLEPILDLLSTDVGGLGSEIRGFSPGEQQLAASGSTVVFRRKGSLMTRLASDPSPPASVVASLPTPFSHSRFWPSGRGLVSFDDGGAFSAGKVFVSGVGAANSSAATELVPSEKLAADGQLVEFGPHGTTSFYAVLGKEVPDKVQSYTFKLQLLTASDEGRIDALAGLDSSLDFTAAGTDKNLASDSDGRTLVVCSRKSPFPCRVFEQEQGALKAKCSFDGAAAWAGEASKGVGSDPSLVQARLGTHGLVLSFRTWAGGGIVYHVKECGPGKAVRLENVATPGCKASAAPCSAPSLGNRIALSGDLLFLSTLAHGAWGTMADGRANSAEGGGSVMAYRFMGGSYVPVRQYFAKSKPERIGIVRFGSDLTVEGDRLLILSRGLHAEELAELKEVTASAQSQQPKDTVFEAEAVPARLYSIPLKDVP